MLANSNAVPACPPARPPARPPAHPPTPGVAAPGGICFDVEKELFNVSDTDSQPIPESMGHTDSSADLPPEDPEVLCPYLCP